MEARGNYILIVNPPVRCVKCSACRGWAGSLIPGIAQTFLALQAGCGRFKPLPNPQCRPTLRRGSARHPRNPYLLAIPGMRESILEGMQTPIDECSDEVVW